MCGWTSCCECNKLGFYLGSVAAVVVDWTVVVVGDVAAVVVVGEEVHFSESSLPRHTLYIVVPDAPCYSCSRNLTYLAGCCRSPVLDSDVCPAGN